MKLIKCFLFLFLFAQCSNDQKENKDQPKSNDDIKTCNEGVDCLQAPSEEVSEDKTPEVQNENTNDENLEKIEITPEVSFPKFSQISGGTSHICALIEFNSSQKEVYCWGEWNTVWQSNMVRNPLKEAGFFTYNYAKKIDFPLEQGEEILSLKSIDHTTCIETSLGSRCFGATRFYKTNEETLSLIQEKLSIGPYFAYCLERNCMSANQSAYNPDPRLEPPYFIDFHKTICSSSKEMAYCIASDGTFQSTKFLSQLQTLFPSNHTVCLIGNESKIHCIGLLLFEMDHPNLNSFLKIDDQPVNDMTINPNLLCKINSSNNKIYCKGLENRFGNPALHSSNQKNYNFTQISEKSFYKIASTHNATCAIASDQKNIYCWGPQRTNSIPELSRGNTPSNGLIEAIRFTQ